MTPREKALIFLLLIVLIILCTYMYINHKYGQLYGTTWVSAPQETVKLKIFFNYFGKVEGSFCDQNGNNCKSSGTSDMSYTKNDIGGNTYKITNNQLILGNGNEQMVLVKS